MIRKEVTQDDSKRRERKFVSVFLGYIGQAVGISRRDNLRANSWQDYRKVGVNVTAEKTCHVTYLI
jgi:hypothetical protein